MNNYGYTRIATQRPAQTARQARAAWWRAQATAAPEPGPPACRPRLHWVVPVTTRIAGA